MFDCYCDQVCFEYQDCCSDIDEIGCECSCCPKAAKLNAFIPIGFNTRISSTASSSQDPSHVFSSSIATARLLQFPIFATVTPTLVAGQSQTRLWCPYLLAGILVGS